MGVDEVIAGEAALGEAAVVGGSGDARRLGAQLLNKLT